MSYGGHSSAGRAPALQAGGHRFDPGWLHQPLEFSKRERHLRWLRSLFRLLFNNSEEARRVRFVLLSRTHLGMRLHYLHLRRVAAMQPSAPVTAETAQAALRVIGSSEKVHVVDALATTGDEGRCSLR